MVNNKLILIHPSFERGGAELSFSNYVYSLKDHFDVIYISSENLNILGTKFIHIKYGKSRFIRSLIANFLFLYHTLNYKKFTVVTFQAHIFLVPFIRFFRPNQKIILRESNNPKVFYNLENSNIFSLNYLKYFLIKKIPYMLSDKIIVINPDIVKELNDDNSRKNKFVFIHNPTMSVKEQNILRSPRNI